MTVTANGNANPNPNPNNQPSDKGWFCPACGAADVAASDLAGGAAGCNICTWRGQVEDLATFHFTHDMGSPDQVARLFFLDLRRLVSQAFAIEVGKLLIKWGFVDAPDGSKKSQEKTRRLLSRYVAAMAQAMARSVIETRQVIEKETHHGAAGA